MNRIYILTALLFMLSLAGCTTAPAEEQGNYHMTYQGTVISIDAPVNPVIAALGEPQSYTEQVSCAFEGLDKTYCYGSFYLATYPKDGVDYISRIWFADDGVATQEGIRIGSSRADVEHAYGGASTDKNTCTSLQGNSKLTILLENDAVVSILYELILE